jgi:hypothetical protein
LYNILEEHLQVSLQMLEMGNCSSLLFPKLTRVVQQCSDLVIVLTREDAEVLVHALQTVTEQFGLYEWGHCHHGKLHHSEMSGSWDAPDYPTCPHTPLQ